MILVATLPSIHPLMRSARVEAVHAVPGTALAPGAKLLDLRVDLSLAVAHDCPPVTYHRIALRERAWLRRFEVTAGDDVAAGAVVALFSTGPDESLDAPPGRAVRVSVAGILHEPDWWRDEPSP